MKFGIDVAIAVARELHKNQEYRGKSYVDGHLIPVMEIVKEYTTKEYVHIAAILHDIIEDTELLGSDVELLFGGAVAYLVWCVTDETGINRKDRKLKTYNKIAGSKYATLIKVADRYINMLDSTKLDMYKEEYIDFKRYLYVPGELDKLWSELDELAK